MPEFRSYAREGQLGRPIQAPDKAKADYNRGTQFVGLLEKEDLSKTKIDQNFLIAWEKKLSQEKSARQTVENAKRESIEAERKQRVDNAKLKADFAEQEAKVNNARIQNLAGLVPSIAEDVKTALDKRKEFDADTIVDAMERSGLTDEERANMSKQILKQDEYNSGNQAWLVKLRETGKITWHQYNAMMQRTGGYGLGFERWDVRQKADGLHTWFAVNSERTIGQDGVTINDLLSNTELPNNSSRIGLLREAYDDFLKESGLSGYNKAFRDKTLKGTLKAEWNSLLNLANKKMLRQSELMGIEKDETTLLGRIKAEAYQGHYDGILDTKLAHHQLKYDAGLLAGLIKRGMVPEEGIQSFLNIKVVDGNGKKGTVADLYPGLKHLIVDAQAFYQQTIYRSNAAPRNLRQQQTDIALQEITDHLMTVPEGDRAAAWLAAMDSLKKKQAEGDKSVDYYRLLSDVARLDPNPETTAKNAQAAQMDKEAYNNILEQVDQNSGIWPSVKEILNTNGLSGASKLKLLDLRKKSLTANPKRKRHLQLATSQLRKDVDGFLGNQILSGGVVGKVHPSTASLAEGLRDEFIRLYDIYTATGSNLTPEAAFDKALLDAQKYKDAKFNDPTHPLYVQTTRNGQPITPATPNLGNSPISSYISEYNQAKQQHGTKDVLSSHMFFSQAEADQIQRAYSNTGPMIPASLRRKASWLANKENITSLEVFRRQLKMHGLDLTPPQQSQVNLIQQTRAVAQNNPAYKATLQAMTNMLNFPPHQQTAAHVVRVSHQPGQPWRNPNNMTPLTNTPGAPDPRWGAGPYHPTIHEYPGTTNNAKAMIASIIHVEAGGPNKYRRVVGRDVPSNRAPFDKMTIQEVWNMAYKNRDGTSSRIGRGVLPQRFDINGKPQHVTYGASSHAAGAGQFHPGTMLSVIQSMGLDPNTTYFTPEIQLAMILKHAENLGADVNGGYTRKLHSIIGSMPAWEGIRKHSYEQMKRIFEGKLRQLQRTPVGAFI